MGMADQHTRIDRNVTVHGAFGDPASRWEAGPPPGWWRRRPETVAKVMKWLRS